MIGWRVFQTRHATTALSGEGAQKYGGRWNTKGKALVYSAATLSLAALEILVHVQDYTLLAAAPYSCIRLEFAPTLVTEVTLQGLPADWQTIEHPECKRIGDAWINQGQTPVLAVPSVVIPQETNYLLNPNHPDFTAILAFPPQPFSFDMRLLK
ncbi:RES domain protein [Solidesulfovibrio fructosivorans JJ]]|uniref:RES domain protein n=1 Tax=Solidesulfovibrio fructosivorans JJ] TaxID=596151 RepID=E1K0Q9_SOLFR|nr:RES family NAD+ phosphorylase [Solidesulfovibrio fructosivorans]EFL49823.1 RES domain protein [Solidesulfovibrio fructosivorans JJ]]